MGLVSSFVKFSLVKKAVTMVTKGVRSKRAHEGTEPGRIAPEDTALPRTRR